MLPTSGRFSPGYARVEGACLTRPALTKQLGSICANILTRSGTAMCPASPPGPLTGGGRAARQKPKETSPPVKGFHEHGSSEGTDREQDRRREAQSGIDCRQPNLSTNSWAWPAVLKVARNSTRNLITRSGASSKDSISRWDNHSCISARWSPTDRLPSRVTITVITTVFPVLR